ncbi:MAG: bifunctional diaminohydroxyphosphoribosylaminopyrimidine deaminase/5-amino-6-(5-phosphoribosylamino)uracil reductase RibD [candidate division Zixibacteria bacterium]|nr:bifunctional diaminohydroxyphosphoribosylaminopyrimidine deaminase/5-amino-6-(5-phosphoribosylamino)uracil reductase RibD [candidate division Zixibacteria bacterium]
MASNNDKEFMELALRLAEKARGKTLPNPMVGAVIVINGKVVGRGYHQGPESAHAEVAAIKSAGAKTKGATIYVTLEPCCHTGRTGPCTEAIKDAGIKKIVYACKDFNPIVNGKGARVLRRAGLKVENGLMKNEAIRLNEVYFNAIKNKRPFVTLKIAQTIDGRIATLSGDSKWITGQEARVFAHKLRSENEAVLVGMGTVKADNPSLTTRHLKGNNPYRIVVSESLEFPKSCKLIVNNKDYKTIIATTKRSLSKFSKIKKTDGLTFWEIKKSAKNRLNLADILQKAYAFGIHSILVEGGSQISTSFLKAKLVDKLVVITAPLFLGSGLNSIGNLEIGAIKNAIKLKNHARFQCGEDQVFVGYPDWKN